MQVSFAPFLSESVIPFKVNMHQSNGAIYDGKMSIDLTETNMSARLTQKIEWKTLLDKHTYLLMVKAIELVNPSF